MGYWQKLQSDTVWSSGQNYVHSVRVDPSPYGSFYVATLKSEGDTGFKDNFKYFTHSQPQSTRWRAFVRYQLYSDNSWHQFYSSEKAVTSSTSTWITLNPLSSAGLRTAQIILNMEYYVSTPPSIPSSLSVSPLIVHEGNSISISWGAGTYATSYRLERSVNGGSYSQIYSGSSTSYSDISLSTWNTVQYRVRSYNSDGYSGFITSPDIVTVTHFPELQLKINNELKVSGKGWCKAGGVLKEIDTIKTRIDGVLKEV